MAPDADAGKSAKRAETVAHFSEYERIAIASAVNQGKRVYHVRVQLDAQCAMPIAARQMIKVALSGMGEVLAMYPADEAVVNLVEIALTSEKSAEQIRVKCRIPTVAQSVRVALLQGKGSSGASAATPSPERAGMNSIGPSGRESAAPVAPEELPVIASTVSDNTLRVDADKIDNVLNLVGELILAKLSPQGYNEISRAKLLQPQENTRGREVIWCHPAFSNRCAFMHNGKELMCVSLSNLSNG
jgi:chemotaxis protein histidine kinase CheA